VSFAAVISDLDGVLVDSAAATSRAWAAWGERHGLDGAAIQAANHGRPARDVVAEHFPSELVDAEAALLLETEVTNTRGVVAFAGAAAVLALCAVNAGRPGDSPRLPALTGPTGPTPQCPPFAGAAATPAHPPQAAGRRRGRRARLRRAHRPGSPSSRPIR
jgi:beta-phosphoglucomutase-like phosphatase (HAD superfamily)